MLLSLRWHSDIDDSSLDMHDATLEQLHEIVAFAERLKEGALVEMYQWERKANGVDARHLILPLKGYAGYNTKSCGKSSLRTTGL
ncbi:hypothetical protein [Pseudomonas sp. 10S4]|uniref:hypothetical protein n=1 Tax=Pseudomonas sp. 10S4 TaxID=3048583 RepID=UPI002AC97137|nr:MULTISPECIES: hypothetical protein [unclassified Pseudomonas]MEB0225023.1 hypothetical protein [Pseudomonas sp. 5S1]MEB0296177.1 hypothetical protein [Pseudomonas sp. 10S4]WPX16581.1 hypothetical protein RHM58_21530 [Pseudomonas sp. 10S4]